MNEAAKQFWAWFRREASLLGEALQANCPPGQRLAPALQSALTAGLEERFRAAAPRLRPELSVARDGVFHLTVSAGGAVALFDDAYAFVAEAPYLPRWEFRALRAPEAPARFETAGVALDLAQLRFSYRLGNDQAVVAVLTDDMPDCDYRTRRALAATTVEQLLGEEDFGRFVSDSLLLEYETWLAATPGARSAPLALIAPTFQRLFWEGRRRRRSDPQITRLRLVS